jgi:hypothetical protein
MLFQYQKFDCREADSIDTVRAPLCGIRFGASFQQWDSRKSQPTYVHMLPTGSTVTGWRLDGCHLELLTCRLSPNLPYGRSVEGCAAAMWRLRVHENVPRVSFSAALIQPPFGTEIEAESGEGIDAQSWSAEGCKLMLATEDGESMSERARLRNWMPFRFQQALAESFPKYLPEGLTVIVPALECAELCQVQFVLAWSSSDGTDQTRRAVDITPAQILSGAGCA